LYNMEFKIDTKTNHREIIVFSDMLDDNLADNLVQMCREYTSRPPGNFIFLFNNAAKFTPDFIVKLLALQDEINNLGQSVYFTDFQEDVLKKIKTMEEVEVLHVVPTLAEAVDMVSME